MGFFSIKMLGQVLDGPNHNVFNQEKIRKVVIWTNHCEIWQQYFILRYSKVVGMFCKKIWVISFIIRRYISQLDSIFCQFSTIFGMTVRNGVFFEAKIPKNVILGLFQLKIFSFFYSWNTSQRRSQGVWKHFLRLITVDFDFHSTLSLMDIPQRLVRILGILIPPQKDQPKPFSLKYFLKFTISCSKASAMLLRMLLTFVCVLIRISLPTSSMRQDDLKIGWF